MINKNCELCGKFIDNCYNTQKYHKNCAKKKEKLRNDNWKKENPEKVMLSHKVSRENHREYFRKYNRRYRKEHSKEKKDYNKEYVKNHLEEIREYNNKHKDLNKIRNQANYYIKIPKNQLCEICNKRKVNDKHHPNYSKPLLVLFVCRKCHAIIHHKEEIILT
jgi:hypothetical protein